MKRGTLNGPPPTGISGTPTIEQDFSLDPTGNWSGYITKAAGTINLNQTRTHNVVNEITAISESVGTAWADPVYNAVGNTTTMPRPGTLSSTYTAKYDAWNRMMEVKAGDDFVGKYTYDGRGRRIIKESYVDGDPSETRDFYYTNSWQEIEERVDDEVQCTYVWGIRYVDELVERDDINEDRFFVCQDANFNVTTILDASGGTVLERYGYRPYGSRTIYDSSWSPQTNSSYAWVYGHQGLMRDDETGLVYNRIRYLHTTLGRFLQRDRWGYVDGMNLYEYTISAPTTNLDFSGDDANTWEEMWCTDNPICCLAQHNSHKATERVVGAKYGSLIWGDDTVVNAVKHCTWMCIVAASRCCSKEQALNLGNAHERGTERNDPQSQAMDLYNNQQGVNSSYNGKSDKKCLLDCVQKAQNYQLYWFAATDPKKNPLPKKPWKPPIWNPPADDFPGFSIDDHGAVIVKGDGTTGVGTSSPTPPPFTKPSGERYLPPVDLIPFPDETGPFN